jgi:hypothetical protein
LRTPWIEGAQLGALHFPTGPRFVPVDHHKVLNERMRHLIVAYQPAKRIGIGSRLGGDRNEERGKLLRR